MKLLRHFSYIVLFMSLVSCGGGSSLSANASSGTTGTGTSTDPIVISLVLSNQTVTGQAPVTVTATVTQGNLKVANTVVTFTTTLGSFNPLSGTALTNANGVADIVLTAGTVRGAGTITAKLGSGESKDISFKTQGDDIGVVGDINISVALVDQSGSATQTITASKPGKLIATVNGISSPVIVTFASTVGDIPIPTAITDSNNNASVDIVAGSSLGAGEVTATISSGQTGKVLLVIGASNVLMGSGSGAAFQKGIADLSLPQISAGGTTVVSVKIIDDQGNLFKEPVDVNFSSSCTSLSTPTASLSSPITTSNGIATSTYLAKGCVGDDPINVTANAGGINLSAATSVNVLSASVGSIEFISVVPTTIGILGTGALNGAESSTIKFKVLDTNSNPVNNQIVNFSLNTSVGNIQLIPSSATTNSDGIVQTVVNSGAVATSVRVQAVIDGSAPAIASQSSLLVISTGIPDQDSFDLSADTLNPEAWELSGTRVKLTARLADAFNNPVPDGTAVSFTTEGGVIEPSCITTKGACVVTWQSQNPRPEGNVLGDANNINHQPEETNTMGQKYGGRATITATAIGEESFPDLNGNGRFDASEMAAFLGTNVSGLPFDLNEAFVDYNEDGYFNPQQNPVNEQAGGELEELIDFNANGIFDVKDGQYNGVLCSIPAHAGCYKKQKSINVRAQLVLVMSTSAGRAVITATNDGVAQMIDADNNPATPKVANPDFNPNDQKLVIAGENTGTVSFVVADLHNQPMPAGTVITTTTTVGSVLSGGVFTWPSDNHNGGVKISVGVKGEKNPKNGTLFIEAKSPNGTVTQLGSVSIEIK